MTPDVHGNVTLVDRDSGKDHVAPAISCREILEKASPAVDGSPRYVLKENYDGKVAKPAKGKAAKDEPVPPEKTAEELAEAEAAAAAKAAAAAALN